MLRYSADRKSVAYLLLTVALASALWASPELNVFLYVPYLFMGVTVAVMSHNHNHISMWKSSALNQATSYLLTLFFGSPSFAWVPTHNQNHHKYNNREGDSGRSPGLFKSNHLLALLTYPTVTSLNQQADIKQYLAELWRRDRRGFWKALSELGVLLTFLGVAFAVDWRKALLIHLIPQQFAIFTIQVFNYVQHVEADADSRWNHSRNFVSPTLNWLLFNNGFHTVHHLKPGVHWSQTPALHREHASKIHPSLLQPSWWKYMGWTFFVRPLLPRSRDRRPLLDAAPFETPGAG